MVRSNSGSSANVANRITVVVIGVSYGTLSAASVTIAVTVIAINVSNDISLFIALVTGIVAVIIILMTCYATSCATDITISITSVCEMMLFLIVFNITTRAGVPVTNCVLGPSCRPRMNMVKLGREHFITYSAYLRRSCSSCRTGFVIRSGNALGNTAEFNLTNCAIYNRIVGSVSAAIYRSFLIFFFSVAGGMRNFFCFHSYSRYLSLTNGTVNNLIVGAFFCASSCLLVFLY